VAPAPSGFWREICGALAIGVAALAGVVLVLQVVAWFRGLPGHRRRAGRARAHRRYALDLLVGMRSSSNR
jgi:hypothetical protein